ncbi:MAG: hypothetical protein M3134_09375 [Actinomycetota bacterium]|nr:hypothetical protein [Actinomycetota bacterium]
MTRDLYHVSHTTGEVTHTFWQIALDYLRPHLNRAEIDIFPAPEWPSVEFTEEDLAAYGYLRTVSIRPRGRGQRTWMAEGLDLTVPATFDAYRTYGYHSIQTTAFRRDNPEAALDNHDGGSSIGIRLTAAELEEFRPLLEERCWPWDELKRWEPPRRKRRRWFRRVPQAGRRP